MNRVGSPPSQGSSKSSLIGRKPQVVDDYDLDRDVLYNYLTRRWPTPGDVKLSVRTTLFARRLGLLWTWIDTHCFDAEQTRKVHYHCAGKFI